MGYLLVSRIEINNANAISSPLTYGFPAITGFTGAVHALSRKISQVDGLQNICLDGVLIACHSCQPQTYRENSYKDFTFIQTRNPLKKDGKTASIIEEGRCHLTVSLVIGVYANDDLADEQSSLLASKVWQLIQQQRIAGGSVVKLSYFEPVTFCKDADIDNFKTRLLPAFILTDAHKTLQSMTQQLQSKNPQATALDALIETATYTMCQAMNMVQNGRSKPSKKDVVGLCLSPWAIKAFHQHLMQAKCKIAVTLNTQANMLRQFIALVNGFFLIPSRNLKQLFGIKNTMPSKIYT